MGAALTAPVKNLSEMGSSEFTAQAQPCSYVSISYLGPVGFLSALRRPTERDGSNDENDRCVGAPGRLQDNGIFANHAKL